MRLDHYVKQAIFSTCLMIAVMVVVFGAVDDVAARDLLRSPSQPVFCRELQRHIPDEGVAFQPGRDVNGRAVAAADLPSQSQFQLRDRFRFPPAVAVIERRGIDERQLGVEGELPLGEVLVEQGRVSFNGTVVDGLNRADVVALCVRKPVVQ